MATEQVYDTAISFAGEDRDYAQALVKTFTQKGIKTFYDEFEEDKLWGINLYDYLFDLYHNKAARCIMLISKFYAAKLWTNHERQAAQARAFLGNTDYILPVRLDDTVIPGLPLTIGYRSWPPDTPDTLADATLKKLERKSVLTDHSPQIQQNAITETGIKFFCYFSCYMAPIPCIHIKTRPHCVINSQEPITLAWNDFRFISLQPNINHHIFVYCPGLPFGNIAKVSLDCKLRYGYVGIYKYVFKERFIGAPKGILSRLDQNPSSI